MAPLLAEKVETASSAGSNRSGPEGGMNPAGLVDGLGPAPAEPEWDALIAAFWTSDDYCIVGFCVKNR